MRIHPEDRFMPVLQNRYYQVNPPRSSYKVLIAIWGGIFLFLAFLLIIILTFRVSNANRIYPGISVGGVDLSGLKKAEAELRLTESLRYPEEGTISLRYNDKTWSAKPRQLGLTLIVRDSVEAALRWGRRGGVLEQIIEQFQAWYEGADFAAHIHL